MQRELSWIDPQCPKLSTFERTRHTNKRNDLLSPTRISNVPLRGRVDGSPRTQGMSRFASFSAPLPPLPVSPLGSPALDVSSAFTSFNHHIKPDHILLSMKISCKVSSNLTPVVLDNASRFSASSSSLFVVDFLLGSRFCHSYNFQKSSKMPTNISLLPFPLDTIHYVFDKIRFLSSLEQFITCRFRLLLIPSKSKFPISILIYPLLFCSQFNHHCYHYTIWNNSPSSSACVWIADTTGGWSYVIFLLTVAVRGSGQVRS